MQKLVGSAVLFALLSPVFPVAVVQRPPDTSPPPRLAAAPAITRLPTGMTTPRGCKMNLLTSVLCSLSWLPPRGERTSHPLGGMDPGEGGGGG